MTKKNKTPLLILLLVCLVVVTDILFLQNNKGLVGIFHINDEKETEFYPPFVSSQIMINEKEDPYKKIYLDETVKISISDDLDSPNLSDWQLEYLSSNPEIISVSQTGVLTPKKEGSATIRVTSKTNVNLYDVMTVEVISRTNSLSLKKDNNYLLLNEVRKLDLTLTGEVRLNSLTYKSSTPDVITVENGYLYAKKVGTSTISITSNYDKRYHDEITLEVKDHTSTLEKPESIRINGIFVNTESITLSDLQTMNFSVGDELIINANTVLDDSRQVIFSSVSSNIECVATNEYVGTYRFKEEGIGTIKISSMYDDTTYMLINIAVGTKNTTYKELVMKNSSSVAVNDYLKLVFYNQKNIIPNSDLTIEITDQAVASYLNGYIIPKKIGSTKVIVRAVYQKDLEEEFILKVTNPIFIPLINYFSYDNATLNNMPYEMISDLEMNFKKGDELSFRLNLYPFYQASYDKVIITSSNENLINLTYETKDDGIYVVIKFLNKGIINLNITILQSDLYQETLAFNIDQNINPSNFDFSIGVINTLTMGEKYNLKLDEKGTLPKDLTYQYISSDNEILSIGECGDLFALQEGEVEITVIAYFNHTSIIKKIKIKVVKNIKTYETTKDMTYETYLNSGSEKIILDFSKSFLNVYQKAYLQITNFPNNNNYQVTSSNEEIIKITKENNLYSLLAIKPGTCDITIINYENPSLNKVIKIMVCDVLPKYYLPEGYNGKLIIDTPQVLNAYVDDKATVTKATLSFADESLAKVVNDQIMPIKNGKTSLTIKITNGQEEYELTLPVIIKISSGNIFNSYQITEIIVYFLFNILIYIVLGALLTKIFLNKFPKKIITIILLIISYLVILVTIIFKKYPTNILILTTVLTFISYLLGIIFSIFLPKLKKRQEEKTYD